MVEMQNGENKVRHLFVSGCARSGTTLLELVLSAHDQIIITPETYFIQKWIGRERDPGAVLDDDGRSRLLTLMKGDEKLAAWPRFDLREFLSTLTFGPDLTFVTVLDALFFFYAHLHGKHPQIIGNKKGVYVTHGRIFKALIPGARFLFIVRDPRDVTKSIAQHFGGAISDIADDVTRRVRRMNELRLAYGDDVRIIRYEDLVLHPEMACREMANFVGVPYSRSMLRYHLQNQQGARVLVNRRAIHENTQRPLDPNLVFQWKKDRGLRQEVLNDVNARTKEMREQFGYE